MMRNQSENIKPVWRKETSLKKLNKPEKEQSLLWRETSLKK